MKPNFRASGQRAARRCAIVFACIGLSACSSVKLWPFGGESQGQARVVPNATQYQCAGGKSFYLRTLVDGAMWVIYPDREFRLEKSAGSASRYSNGIATLDINAGEVSLNDGPGLSFAGCKEAAAAKSAG